MTNNNDLQNLFKEIESEYGCEPSFISAKMKYKDGNVKIIENILEICLMWWDGPVVTYYAGADAIVYDMRALEYYVLLQSDEKTIDSFLLGKINDKELLDNSKIFVYNIEESTYNVWVWEENDSIRNELLNSEHSEPYQWMDYELLKKIKRFMR